MYPSHGDNTRGISEVIRMYGDINRELISQGNNNTVSSAGFLKLAKLYYLASKDKRVCE